MERYRKLERVFFESPFGSNKSPSVKVTIYPERYGFLTLERYQEIRRAAMMGATEQLIDSLHQIETEDPALPELRAR